MRTSFHHQPEAQHPKSSAIHKIAGRLPHLCAINGSPVAANPDLRGEILLSAAHISFGPSFTVSLSILPANGNGTW
jgi:hypothetical protein